MTIHPFSEGKGRTARLLMNLSLLKAGYPPLVLLPESRPAYHEARQAVQVEGRREVWYGFLYPQLVRTTEEVLRLLGAPPVEELR